MKRLYAAAMLIACSCLVAPTLMSAAETTKVTVEDGETAKLVANMVAQRHISHPMINDEIAGRLLNRFVEIWDPQKLYFLSADIDSFKASANILDDQIRSGNVLFANTVFERFQQRMAERGALIETLIDQEHDFTVDEEMVLDPDDIDFAKTEAELAERWRKRIKFDLLMLKMDDEQDDDPKVSLKKRYSRNRNLMSQTEGHEVLELYLSSLTHCLDPHSTYMSPQTLDEFRMNMELKLEGIGARLRWDDGFTIVEDVIKGGAAAAHGSLAKGDKITGVDPDGPGPEEMINVNEMKLSKVVTYIRGKSGTSVTLRVLKDGGGNENYTMNRQLVELTEQQVQGKIIEGADWIDGRPSRIGVLNIPSFYKDFREASRGGDFRSATKDVRKVLAQFNAAKVDTLIVDLRMNGGGSLDEAIELSGLFIPRGPVVQVREPNNAVTPYADEDPDMAWRKPMIVVCNRLSASASEIFAGAIKDYRRGIVVGDRTTHGKGTVQNVMQVTQPGFFRSSEPRGAVKLTISKFYRVNGDSTQNKGVVSDVILPSILNHRDIGEDSLDNALEFDRIPRAKYMPFTGYYSDSIIKNLGQQSQARLVADTDFQKLNKNIARYVERKNRKTISLNESVLRAEEEEIKRERKEEEKIAKEASGASSDEDIFPENFYNRELVNITLDYSDLLNGRQASNN